MDEMQIEDRLADLRMACWRALRTTIKTLEPEVGLVEMAARAGVSPRQVTRWRNGTSQPLTMEKTIRVLSLLGSNVWVEIKLS